jgi:hypothetical protein
MIAGYLGNSIEMIERHYGHHHPDHLRQASEALAGPVRPEPKKGPEN